MQKTKIILVVGSSGAGKTHLTHYLHKMHAIPYIVSYTTRPMRDGEVNGIDHHFISPKEVPSKESMLAYTKFGDFEYFTLRSQIPGEGICSYVVDEKGVVFMQERFGDVYNVLPIYVQASDETRKSRGVDQARIDRDKDRIALPIRDYTYIFNTDCETDEFEQEIDMVFWRKWHQSM